MRRMWMVVVALLLAQAGAIAQDGEQPAATDAEVVESDAAIVDGRPSGELSNEELQTRIAQLQELLKREDLPAEAREPWTALLAADQQELERRIAAAQPADLPTGEQPSTSEPSAADAPAQALEETAPPATKTAPEQPPQEVTEQADAPAAQPAQPADAEPAPPADAATEAAPPPEPTPEQPAATAEPAPQPSVEAPPQVSAAAEEKAKALLADTTPADSLSDEALKARVEEYRALLDEPELSRKTAKALRQRLKADRQALRARVAAQEAAEAAAQEQAATAQPQPAPEQPQEQPAEAPKQPTPQQTTPQQTAAPAAEEAQKATTQPSASAQPQGKQQPQQALAAQPAAEEESVLEEIAPLLPLVLAPTVAEIPLLLQDRRPSDELADDELNRRILATREALQDEEDYSRDELTLFDQQLQQDRLELNNRLLENRNQRARVYQSWSDPNLELNAAAEPEAPNSIFAAEVDDAEMWEQIVVAPLEPLPRRYKRHELVQQAGAIMNEPEVRAAIPSIELDTITFGFNEAFVREEEIFDLDRIARMIERVVAAHPDEIFMLEGHTDAVGADAYNLRLSRQRAEAVKAALTRYYLIAPENLATVGLGERYLKIWTPEAEEENRRVTVRRVTPLVEGYGEE